jgi:hypothetical protein
MTEDPLREIRELEQGVRLVAHVEADADGYLDRSCPFVECGAYFKVHEDDWSALSFTATTYCVFCRHEADPSAFVTPEQVEYLKSVAAAEFVRRITAVLQPAIDEVNNAPPNPFFRFRLDLRPPSLGPAIPPAAVDLMKVRSRCDACGCRVAFIGTAFFCHGCGASSVERTFDQTVARIRRLVGGLDALLADQDADTARDFELHVVEGTVSDLVTAFQRLAEVLYPRLPRYPGSAPRRNAFQNLGEGSVLLTDAGGRPYAAILAASEMQDLRRFFEQRHVLEHLDGVVDADYIRKSGDITYAVGQRLVVRREGVLRMADLVEKLAAGLRTDAA